MKRITLLCALLIMSSISYAEIGRHNLQINIGGGYQNLRSPNPNSFLALIFSPLEIPFPETIMNGGTFTIDVGYLFHSVRQNNWIHGLDLRANFSVALFDGTHKGPVIGDFDQNSDRLSGGFAMIYTFGHQLKSGRLMFDIIGYGLNYSTMNTERSQNNVTTATYTEIIAMQYIFPGVQFIMNNGLTIAWRNKFEIDLIGTGADKTLSNLYGITTAVTFGFTFGSGKQPWENKVS